MATRRPDPNQMSFLQHLDELRSRLFVIVAALAVATAVGWLVREPVLDLLMAPVQENLPKGVRPVFTTLTEPFLLAMKVAFFTGLVLAFPVVVLQLWLFIAPGLHRHERRYALPFLVSGSVFFFLGAAFAYLVVFPSACRFLISFAGDRFTPMLEIGRIFSFEMRLILSLGLVFQLPVLTYLLARLGLVTAAFLWRIFKYAVIAIFVLAAILTPTPDAVTMTLVAAPMIGLYLLGIAVAAVFGREREPLPTEPEDEDEEEDEEP
jgi:sec-independent protein translocase protein TatC